MNKRKPNLKILGVTAEVLQLPLEEGIAWVVKTKLKTDDPEMPEFSIPTVWTEADIEKCQSPKQVAQLISALLENTQQSIGDLIEMYRGDGMYADCYDDDGNWKKS